MKFPVRPMIACALIALSACTTTVPESRAVPDLTFAHLQPLPVRVGRVNVENHFQPGNDIRDVSSSFPTPPDVVLRRYAETRLKPAGAAGVLNFMIEDAHIYQSEAETGTNLTNWTGLDKSDVYDITLKIVLFAEYADGGESNHTTLNINRSISIPQRFSLAEKEQEKFRFLEMLMGDVDKAVTQALVSELNIAGY